MVLHIVLSSVTALNAAYWTSPLTNPAVGQELLAYANYVGQALVQGVRFDVNGNPLDEYDSEVQNFHEKFFVTPEKRVGWARNMGQELPNEGYTTVTSTSLAGSQNFRGALCREGVTFWDGPQTSKIVQPQLDLWIPLLFW
jgi:hypothetical protein